MWCSVEYEGREVRCALRRREFLRAVAAARALERAGRSGELVPVALRRGLCLVPAGRLLRRVPRRRRYDELVDWRPRWDGAPCG